MQMSMGVVDKCVGTGGSQLARSVREIHRKKCHERMSQASCGVTQQQYLSTKLRTIIILSR